MLTTKVLTHTCVCSNRSKAKPSNKGFFLSVPDLGQFLESETGVDSGEAETPLAFRSAWD